MNNYEKANAVVNAFTKLAAEQADANQQDGLGRPTAPQTNKVLAELEQLPVKSIAHLYDILTGA